MNAPMSNQQGKMTQTQLDDLFYRIKDLLIAQGVIRNCTKCNHWDHAKEICKKYNQRPPTKIILSGCPEFDLDEIPF